MNQSLASCWIVFDYIGSPYIVWFVISLLKLNRSHVAHLWLLLLLAAYRVRMENQS